MISSHKCPLQEGVFLGGANLCENIKEKGKVVPVLNE
jgi:hypothetical protein